MKEKYVKNDMVYTMDENGIEKAIGKIASVEVSIDHPENMIGISRVNNAILYDENDDEIYNDPDIIDNTEYHSDRDLMDAVAKRYSVDRQCVKEV